MLHDDFFQNADVLVHQQLVERLCAPLPVLRRELQDALTARSLQRLADEGGERHHVLQLVKRRIRVNQQPLARNPFFEQLVELRLVIEEMPVRLVVHPADNAVGNAARDDGLALRIVEFVHLCDFVVHIARVVLHSTAEHVAQQPNAGFAGALMQQPGGFPHGFPVHLEQTLEEIRKTAHADAPFLLAESDTIRR